MVLAKFRVYGLPAPQGSKRSIGNNRFIESSKKLPAWRKAIEDTVRREYQGEPIDQPVFVRADFFVPRPKNPRFDVPATPADTDKLQRALGDGLEKGGVLKNDSRIVRWEAQKHYATDDEPTGVNVEILEMK